MSETYSQRLRCYNCDEYSHYNIPIGVKVENFMKKQKCSSCGCKTR